MRVINREELAELLHEARGSLHSDEERIEMGGETWGSWFEEAEFNKDDFRAQADYILSRARVALKPSEKKE